MYTTKYGIRPMYNWWTRFVLAIPLIRELYSTRVRLMLLIQDLDGNTLNWYENICRVFNVDGLALKIEYATHTCNDRCDVQVQAMSTGSRLKVTGFTPHTTCRAVDYTTTIKIFKDNG